MAQSLCCLWQAIFVKIIYDPESIYTEIQKKKVKGGFIIYVRGGYYASTRYYKHQFTVRQASVVAT